MVGSVWDNGIDFINKLKVKDLKAMFLYNFKYGNFKGIPKIVKIVEAVTNYFRKDLEGIFRGERPFIKR